MTRLESGGIQVSKEWHPLEEVVGAALSRARAAPRRRPSTIQLPPDLPLVPARRRADRAGAHQPARERGQVHAAGSPIEISAGRRGPRGHASTSPTAGPGFPPGDEARVFEKFYRGHAPGRRSGAGLGLTICRAIVEAHGGRIWAENRAGGGAVVPLHAARCGGAPESGRRCLSGARRRGRSRVRHDRAGHPGRRGRAADPALPPRRARRPRLPRRRGDDRRGGLMQAATRKPDLVLLDLGLPDMDGLEVTAGCASGPPCRSSCCRPRPGAGQDRRARRRRRRLPRPSRSAWANCWRASASRSATPRGPARAGESDVRRRRPAGRSRRAGASGVGEAEVHLTPTEYRLLADARPPRRQGADPPAAPEGGLGPAHAEQTHYLRVYMAQLRHKLEATRRGPAISSPSRASATGCSRSDGRPAGDRRPRRARGPPTAPRSPSAEAAEGLGPHPEDRVDDVVDGRRHAEAPPQPDHGAR